MVYNTSLRDNILSYLLSMSALILLAIIFPIIDILVSGLFESQNFLV